MKFNFKKKDNTIMIFNDDRKVKITNNKDFIVKDIKIAKLIIKELNKFGITNLKKLPVTSLSMAISNLTESDREKLEVEIVKILYFDSCLYRHQKNLNLNKLLDKKLNNSINFFNQQFYCNLVKIYNSLGNQKTIFLGKFSKYLNNMKLQNLYLFYRISKLTNSVVLTYNYFSNCYGVIKLLNLSNIESKYQQAIWGHVIEQKIIDDEEKKIMKNFSIFF